MPAFLLSSSIISEKKTPKASLVVSPEFAVLGSVIVLDSRLSSDPDGLTLTYHFNFLSVPIGSKIASEGFKTLDESGAMVSFAPDVVGKYVVGVVVSNGTYESQVASAAVDVRALVVPHARGLVPDGKFIWSYLRDVWTQVDGREFFETLWSALIQIAGGELLKLYQVDYNKSIRDIQDLFQRRWLRYEPTFEVGRDSTFILGGTAAGREAVTGASGDNGLAVIADKDELLVVQGAIRPDLTGRILQIQYSRNPENVGSYLIAGPTAKAGGLRLVEDLPKNPTNTSGETSDVIVRNVGIEFDFGSPVWSVGVTKSYDFFLSELYGFPYYKSEVPPQLDDVRVGDVALIQSGVNAGLYRIIERSGSYIIVDKKPAGSSSGAESSQVTIYRPVGFTIPAVETALTDTVTVPLSEAQGLETLLPGRLIVVNKQTYAVTRVSVDMDQREPLVSFSIDTPSLVPGLMGLPWRIPHTLVSESQDFEAMGVSAGDVFTVTLAHGSEVIDIPCQVVGAHGKKLGFVLTNEALQDGEVPEIPPSFMAAIAERFNISTASVLVDGSLSLSDEAKSLHQQIGSIFFQREYWNVELPYGSQFQVGRRAFELSAKSITRNRLLPVDASITSIPALQEYISQPTVVEEAGKLYVARGEKRFEITHRPVVALERSHYLVDGEDLLSGEMTFRTGSDILDVEGGDFIDLSVMPGDIFHIESPITLNGDYPVVSVVSRNKLKLARPIPQFALSLFATGQVSLRRSRPGRFVRFIPGLFTAKNPAPPRLWAEVTFFDNAENVERNFGVMVGLTRQDLEKVTTQASYRQAVAGLMFAYVNGPAVDKIRLGVSLLLGLPFTEKRGIIRSIDTSYRSDAFGAPVLGRILVEDLDETDTPAGVSRVYTFPVDPISELSGVDLNPATGLPYVVGDTVEAFASLSKGVELADSALAIRGTLTAEQLLQRSHSAKVRINDNIFQPSEVGLVSTFLRKITPSYVAVTIASTSEMRDQVVVKDKVRLNLRGATSTLPSFVDTVGLSLPLASIFDLRSTRGIYPFRVDETPFIMVRAGRDLAISSNILTVPSGGLVDPGVNQTFASPLVEPGYILEILDGVNAGLYPISSVTDSTIVISGQSFLDLPAQHFVIYRPVSDLLHSGTITNLANSSYLDPDTGLNYPLTTVTVSFPAGGLRKAMVTAGDWLVTDDGLTRYTVVKIDKTGSVWDKVVVTPQVTGAPGTYKIFRPGLMVPRSVEITLATPSGTLPSAARELEALADVGDEIVVLDDSFYTAQVRSIAPCSVAPPLPAGTYTVELRKKLSGSTPIVFDQALRTITDSVKLTTTYTTPPPAPTLFGMGGVFPNTGPVGTPVVFGGANLHSKYHPVVRFNGTQAGITAVSEDGTRLYCIVPAGATSGPVTLTTDGGVASKTFTVT